MIKKMLRKWLGVEIQPKIEIQKISAIEARDGATIFLHADGSLSLAQINALKAEVERVLSPTKNRAVFVMGVERISVINPEAASK